MAERAHPEDPNFQDRWIWERRYGGLIPWPCRVRSPWKQGMIARYGFCQPYAEGKHVLDIPCGVGWGTSLLRGTRRIVGVDISADAIAYAQRHYGKSAEFRVGDMRRLDFPDGSFELVICLEGIEHVPQEIAREFVSESARVLAAGGLLILTNPLPDPERPANPYHEHEYTQSELRALIQPGFDVVSQEVRDLSGVQIAYLIGRVRKP